MFTITNETGIVYKNAEAYLFKVRDSGFEYAADDHSFDKLKEQFSSARDLTEKGRVVTLNGNYHYLDKNAYGQTQFEGDITTGDAIAVVAIGTFIDMSDSDFVLVNCSEKQFWRQASAILQNKLTEFSGFRHHKDRKALEPLAEYAQRKAE